MHHATTLVLASVLGLYAASMLPVQAQPAATAQRFDFRQHAAALPATGAGVTVPWDAGGAPRYDAARGYGFVTMTAAIPARAVHVSAITRTPDGMVITEPVVDAGMGSDDYNHFGMAFRIRAAPGAYTVTVRTTSTAADTTVSVSGLQASRLLTPGYWDAASLLPNRTPMVAQGHDWSFRYVNGRDFIDIEVEPRQAGVPVGLAEIVLTPLAPSPLPAGVLPAIYTLGDSTVKTYTFDEAPMSGWGQVFGALFDPARVRVINYAMGGRSFRNAYAEGRLNDLLMTGHVGDIVMIQFGHNDESADETRRFGRGSTEAMYAQYIREVYLPAIRARGLLPVFVTPMSRVSFGTDVQHGVHLPGHVYVNSFDKRRFPQVMKALGAELNVPVVDLNARSIDYYNAAGPQAVSAMVMAIEAGETPGKTNDGSYANGHPANKIDGTHFKETMSKQYARLVVTELQRLAAQGNAAAAGMVSLLTPPVRQALASNDWSVVYPEIAPDIAGGEGAYYRNQIEKLLQLGALHTNVTGHFDPAAPMRTGEFSRALTALMQLPAGVLAGDRDAPLTREAMGTMLFDAYRARFGSPPAYMTDYNGKTAVPGSPGYDPNLGGGARGAMYYPLLSWEQLQDSDRVAPAYIGKLRQAYELGLIRSESGIERGRMMNGRLIEPQATVSRAKAAKTLYFMWVLTQAPKRENQRH